MCVCVYVCVCEGVLCLSSQVKCIEHGLLALITKHPWMLLIWESQSHLSFGGSLHHSALGAPFTNQPHTPTCCPLPSFHSSLTSIICDIDTGFPTWRPGNPDEKRYLAHIYRVKALSHVHYLMLCHYKNEIHVNILR